MSAPTAVFTKTVHLGSAFCTSATFSTVAEDRLPRNVLFIFSFVYVTQQKN